MPSKTLWHSESYKRLKYKKLCHSKVYFLPLFSSSAFHPRSKTDFQHFLAFIRGWQAFFISFLLSSADDERFLSLFRFHPWMTDSFSRKSSIYCRIWAAFPKSRRFTPVSEWFFAFSAFRWPTTGCFHRFSLIACKRNAVFRVFCISLTSDEWFSAFFDFPSWGKVDFRWFLTPVRDKKVL